MTAFLYLRNVCLCTLIVLITRCFTDDPKTQYEFFLGGMLVYIAHEVTWVRVELQRKRGLEKATE
jgi:hypothetical protein